METIIDILKKLVKYIVVVAIMTLLVTYFFVDSWLDGVLVFSNQHNLDSLCLMLYIPPVAIKWVLWGSAGIITLVLLTGVLWVGSNLQCMVVNAVVTTLIIVILGFPAYQSWDGSMMGYEMTDIEAGITLVYDEVASKVITSDNL
jgi:hypothetical protein